VPADSPCEVCRATDVRVLYTIDGYDIVRCRECGLVCVANPPGEAELIALYGEAYYEDDGSAGYTSYASAESRKRHHDRSLLRILDGLGPRGDLLEVGCAYGYFLDEARRSGWTVRGVEPSGHAATYARDRLGLDVTQIPFAELPVEPESQDAIVLWDVVEHLSNPRATVELAERWLRSGGTLALSTGDIDSIAARLHGPDWSLMTPPWHQFYFSRKTIRRLLESVGLELVRLGGDGSIAVDPGAGGSSRIPRVVSRILGAEPVTRVARRLGAGTILYAYARKPSGS
jgi:SAM-dependent methyltransferase